MGIYSSYERQEVRGSGMYRLCLWSLTSLVSPYLMLQMQKEDDKECKRHIITRDHIFSKASRLCFPFRLINRHKAVSL